VVRATLSERNKPGMTLAELSRIAQTRGDEYRWMQAAQQKERAEEAATRLRRHARALVTPRYPVRPRTSRSESGEQRVATTTPPLLSGSGTAASFPCWQCNQTGHWAEECPKVDPRLRARQAQNSRWAKDKSRPGRFQKRMRPPGPPVVATAGDNESSSGSESPLERGESNPQAGKPAASSSESDDGNA